MHIKIKGQIDKTNNLLICDALEKNYPALYATIRELAQTEISLTSFLKIWKAHNVSIIEKLSDGRLTNEDVAVQFHVYIKKRRAKKHLQENLKQFQLLKRMLENLDLRDDERLWLNKHYYGLKQKIDIAEDTSSDEEDADAQEAEANDEEDADEAQEVDAQEEEDADEADTDDAQANKESSYEEKRRLRIVANRKKIQELSSLFK